MNASGADQCTKPIGQRDGAWVCLNQTQAKKDTGFCNSSGCYDLDGVSRVYFNGGAVYGYGDRELGGIYVGTLDTSNGRQLRNNTFSWRSDRGVNSLTLQAEILDMPKSSSPGSALDPALFATKETGPVNANSEIQWLGGQLIEFVPSPITYTTIVHEATWTDAEFPGRWFFYAKTPRWTSTNDAGWRLSEDWVFPKSPYGSGYRNA